MTSLAARAAIATTAVTLAAAWSAVALGAPPDVKCLLPAGGAPGTTVECEVTGTLDEWPVQVWTNSSHLTASSNPDQKGQLCVAIADDCPPGPYWLRLVAASGVSALRPFLVGCLPQKVEPQPERGRQSNKIQDADLPVTVHGRLSRSGQVDQYRCHLEAGQTLIASVDAYSALGSPMDGVLQVVDAVTGAVLLQNDDRVGLDPGLEWRVPRTGPYVVRLFAFPSTPDSAIRFSGGDDYVYRLTLTASAYVDHAYPLAVTESQLEHLSLVGLNLSGGGLVYFRDTSSSEPWIHVAQPPAAGWGSIALVSHACAWETNDVSLEAPLACDLPVTLSGCIAQPGDEDAYRIAARKGDRLEVDVASASLGFPLDPVVEIVGADGKRLAQNDDASRNARDCAIEYRVPEDGEYRVVVRDLYGSGSTRHVYRMTLRLAEPGFRLTVESDRFTGTVGKTLEIPVKVERQGRLEQPIEVRLRGMDGDAAELASATATRGERNTSEVVLRIEPQKAFQGPVTIEGAATGISGVVGCTAPTVIEGRRTCLLWLTVTAGDEPQSASGGGPAAENP